ncbi:MerR family transcriptional regulator [Streptomyces sp. NPDC020125]|uniref:helix-turn-helix domain-containing protein n=1 Tax=Streptomyces sp. NPDC020125 TaxID=3154593 RepID=UPI0033D71ED5
MTRGTQDGNTGGTQGGNTRGTQGGNLGGTQGGDTVGIGELAARTGLPVKTIRYYSDIGLLPESGRTPGGHRRYAADALPGLRLIQRLRALGTPISAIAAVMAGERSLDELVSRELDAVQEQLREATWRREVLRSLDDCPAPERPRRLALLAGVGSPDDAHDRLVRYWHWALPAGLPRRLAQAVIDGAVPAPPTAATPTTPTAATPNPATVLAYAELHALATADDRRRQPQAHQVGDVASFYAGLLDACALAGEALSPAVRSGAPRRSATSFAPTPASTATTTHRRSARICAPCSAAGGAPVRSRCATGGRPSPSPARPRHRPRPPARDTSRHRSPPCTSRSRASP